MTSTPRRAIDHVLEPGFVAELESISPSELRRRRVQAQDVEDELSYARRLLQGKLDILRHELERREAEHHTDEQGVLLDRLTAMLSRGRAGGSRGGRSRVNPRATAAPHRRDDDDGAFGVHLTRIKEMSASEMATAVETLVAEERKVSERRRAVHGVIDVLAEALKAGLREGRISADDLLKG